MEKRLAILLTVVLACGVASATSTWVGGDGNWSNDSMWDSGVPGWETAQITHGTVTVDTDAIAKILRAGYNSGDTCVIEINDPNVTLHIEKDSSSGLFCIGYASNSSATVNHSAGLVKVIRSEADPRGETRLAYSSSTATGIYNLSGTGILDTQVLRRGDKSYDGQFNATGGTLIVRAKLYKFGTVDDGYGFDQGTCLFAPGGLNNAMSIDIGDSSNTQDYAAGTGAVIELDLVSDSVYDELTSYGDVDLTGATLKPMLHYTPSVGTTWDVWTIATSEGKGGVDSLPSYITGEWVDTDADNDADTLRLTYVPEPATLSLLGLGALALIRRRRR